jgi:hypothetical protein
MLPNNKKGKTRLTWLSPGLDDIVQKVKEKQGFNSDSSFIRHCILHYLESMSVLTTKAHEAIALPKSERDQQ